VTVIVARGKGTVNPVLPESDKNFSPELIAYVVREIGYRDTDYDSVIVIEAETDGKPLGLGSIHEVRTSLSDSTGKLLGRFQVIGVRYYDSGAIFGFVPNNKVLRWVVTS
jgi:hypothetical protein